MREGGRLCALESAKICFVSMVRLIIQSDRQRGDSRKENAPVSAGNREMEADGKRASIFSRQIKKAAQNIESHGLSRAQGARASASDTPTSCSG
jgi:hypothetical protein